MTFCIITNIISPHLLPLAKKLERRIGDNFFRYVATESGHDERVLLGWGEENVPDWVLLRDENDIAATWDRDWVLQSDGLLCGHRFIDYFEKRNDASLTTFYMSERWFKPPYGMLRLFHPAYLHMALRFYRLLDAPRFYYLPMGVHAANDMLRLVRLFAVFPRWLFRAPLATPQELCSKILLWGYFVEPSTKEESSAEKLWKKCGQVAGNRQSVVNSASIDALMNSRTHEFLKVLWVGRMLRWKRVATLIKAVGCLLKEGRNIQLTLVGHGPEEARLRKLSDQILKSLSAAGAASDMRSSASGLSSQEEPLITFHPPVPIAQVRDFMRQADVYVLPSDGGEGWGAVVNEAMEEGCTVIATHECGAGATMIKDGQNGLLFRAGDARALANRLRRMQDEPELRQELANNGRATVGQIWGPDVAAERLVAFCQAVLDGQPCPRYSDGPLSEALG